MVRLIRTSIAGKLVLIVVGVVLLTLTITTADSIRRELTTFNEASKSELSGTAQILSSSIAGPLSRFDRGETQAIMTSIGKLPDIIFVLVRTTDGNSFAEMGQAVILPDRNITVTDEADLFVLMRSVTMSATVPVVKSGQPIGSITVYRDVRKVRDRLTGIIANAVSTALITCLLAILAAWFFQRAISQPIQRLATLMAKVRETSDFNVVADKTTRDEVGDLVDAFNDMLGNIRERDDKLAAHRRNLEATVEKRTRQFREARDEAVNANAAKSEFLATMSHEIRTPMNGIMVMAELLSAAELLPRHKRYAGVIVNSGNSLLSIINDILDLSKIEAGKMDLEEIEYYPARVVGDVINLFSEKAASKGLGVACYVAPDVPQSVIGDPVRVNQIVCNLVNNAIKFTAEGSVTISVETVSGDEGRLRFAVTDTGIGIPEDKLGKVFESFSQADQSTTRQYGGTGLGLSICQKLVTAMNGEIAVTSRVGEGSCFFFEIDAPPLKAPQDRHDLSAQRIAVVMKECAARDTLLQSLRDHAAQIVTLDQASAAGVRVDYLIAPASVIGAMPRDRVPRGRICLAAIGDNAPENLIADGIANDLLFQPVLPADIYALIGRMTEGRLLGKDAISIQNGTASTYATFPSCRVLVADDSAVNREVIIEAMKCLDARVTTVANGLEAVDTFAQNDFDIVFMDCSMPEMDGYEATQKIREFEVSEGREKTPVIALTAQMAGTATDKWQNAGMDEFLTKPFTLESLSQTMARFVSAAAGEMPQAADAASDQLNDIEPVPAAMPTAVNIFDEDVLEELRRMGAASGKDLALRAMQLFTENAPATLVKIAAALKADDMSGLASAAHALKSMSYNSGAMRLGQACAIIEEAAAETGMVSAASMQEMVSLYAQTVDAASARLA